MRCKFDLSSNWHPFEVVDRGSEAQLQTGDNCNC